MSDYRVLEIYRDKSGILWLGTGAGLNKLDEANKQFTNYREKDGLPNDVIYSILEDEQHNLWLSTNKGISRFDPKRRYFYEL